MQIEANIEDLIPELQNGSNKKFMGIDLGRKNIGIAICSYSIKVCVPIMTITNKSLGFSTSQIFDLCTNRNIDSIIIGVPFNDQENHIPKYIFRFAEALNEKFNANSKLINLYLQDETLSSHEANILLTEAGLKRKKRDKKDDALAAAIILESFITKIKSRISTSL